MAYKFFISLLMQISEYNKCKLLLKKWGGEFECLAYLNAYTLGIVPNPISNGFTGFFILHIVSVCYRRYYGMPIILRNI